MDERRQGSSLLYGEAERRHTGAREPRGPHGVDGRLVALRPNRESGAWFFGWIGSAVTLSVLPPSPTRSGGEPGYIWKTHISQTGDQLVLTEDGCRGHRHMSWRELPSEIRKVVRNINTETPFVDNRSTRQPLHPNF